jgi:spermidine synthase
MGFTLRAALAVLDAQARITVAELVPAVIVWARGPMADIFGDSWVGRKLRSIMACYQLTEKLTQS